MIRMKMKEITQADYLEYIKNNKELIFRDRIGKREVRIEIGKERDLPEKALEPKNFELDGTTVWSYPHRGDWATHSGDYRGNWPPQMARNIILRYSKPGDLVLDQMCGSGTTLIECKLLERNAIGVDINLESIMLTRDRLNFTLPRASKAEQKTYIGDAGNLDLIDDESIDLIATHPPYANIIPYSSLKKKKQKTRNLSNAQSINKYLESMQEVARECYRVLKHNGYCAILVGDTRKEKHYIPIAYRVMQAFLNCGFILKEDVIKHQWRCKATPFWLKKSIEANFLLIMHEHLFIFRKPEKGEKTEKFGASMKSE